MRDLSARGFMSDNPEGVMRDSIDELAEGLKLSSQSTWQLALEASALKKQLEHVEREISFLGEQKSGAALGSRESIKEKILAIEKELDSRKQNKIDS